MQIEDIHIGLIVRYLKKDISEAGKNELFQWVYENQNNEKLFYQLKDIWESARYETITNGVNTDSEWEKLALSAMQKESDTFNEKKRSVQMFYRAVQIAAIVVVTFGIGFFVQKYLPEESNYASVNVPYGAKSELELPDGSKVWVNAGSKIKYPTNLDAKEINLYLEGEAYFDIVKNPKRSVNVKTASITIQVHGTTFNVKSYNDENIVETTLIEGSISITGQVGDKVIKEPIFLKPNEQATLIKSSEEIEITDKDAAANETAEETQPEKEIQQIRNVQPRLQIVEGVETEDIVLWRYNVLLFKNERFEDLAVKLERWYNVEIDIRNDDLKNSRYTGTFEKETIEQAMKALSLSLPFSYEMDKNQIKILKTVK